MRKVFIWLIVVGFLLLGIRYAITSIKEWWNEPSSTTSTTPATTVVREKTFVVKDECDTPCSLNEQWGETTRTSGRPVLVKYFGKSEWFALSGDENTSVPITKFSVGEAKFVSNDKINPAPVHVQVGSYETK